jgi:DNA-binding response OmpR family regulator
MNVLIIDDDAAITDSISAYLRMKKHGVRVFNDSEKVIRHLTESNHANRYDTILVDVFMPGLEGVELIQMIRRALVYCDIIVMSGFEERNGIKIETLIKDYDVKGFLKKPFKVNELMDHIQF